MSVHKNYILTTTTAPNLSSWLQKLKEFELDNIFETRILGRGYEYVNGIQNIEITDNNLTAKSRGAKVYDLLLRLNDSKIKCSCTCLHERACKHMAALLLFCIGKEF